MMDRYAERVMDLVESIIAPEIMTLHEALTFLQNLELDIQQRADAIRDDLGDQ